MMTKRRHAPAHVPAPMPPHHKIRRQYPHPAAQRITRHQQHFPEKIPGDRTNGWGKFSGVERALGGRSPILPTPFAWLVLDDRAPLPASVL